MHTESHCVDLAQWAMTAPQLSIGGQSFLSIHQTHPKPRQLVQARKQHGMLEVVPTVRDWKQAVTKRHVGGSPFTQFEASSLYCKLTPPVHVGGPPSPTPRLPVIDAFAILTGVAPKSYPIHASPFLHATPLLSISVRGRQCVRGLPSKASCGPLIALPPWES